MAPYPTASQIASIFQSIGPNGGNFINHVDSNANFKVMGHEHSTKADHSSPQKVADEFFGQFDFVDWDTINIDVLHVIGGGDSPWASVELSSKGKSKKGKTIHHEFVFITNFNEAGKITQIRAYLDTAHLESHFAHHRG